MPEFLKGNFKTRRIVQQDQDSSDRINEEFERTALKRLGGSIAFVSRKGFIWEGDENDRRKPGHSAGQK